MRAKTPGGSICLQHTEDGVDVLDLAAEPLGQLVEIDFDVTTRIERIDEFMGDGAIGDGAQRQRDLLDQVIAQRRRGRDDLLEVEVRIRIGAEIGAGRRASVHGRSRASPGSAWPGSSGKTLSSEVSRRSAIVVALTSSSSIDDQSDANSLSPMSSWAGDGLSASDE